MKKLIFILIIACFFIFLFEKCRKGRCLGTLKFTQEALNIVPYKTGDIITLKDSFGNIMQYHIDRFSYFSHYTNGNPNQENYDQFDYYIVEENHISFDGWPSISLLFSSPFLTPLTFGYLMQDIHINNHPEIGYFTGGCEFSNSKLILNQTPGINNYTAIVQYYDTLHLLNKKYYHVFGFSHNIIPNDTFNFISNVFYTIDKGIIGLRTSKKYTWCLN